ncbi:MAG: hypothetical protein AAF631_12935 [Pseudomonadota bacterium]
MDTTLIYDLIRYGHLLVVAAAMGAAFYADWTVLRSLNRPISFQLIEGLSIQHKFVARLFVGVWVTGAVYIWWKTGLTAQEMSPKIITKVGTVTILSLNAFAIGGIALPLMRRNMGMTFLDLNLRNKLTLALAAAVSTTSWLLALALGTSEWLTQGGWAVLTPLLMLTYSAGILAAFFATFVVHFAFVPEGPGGKVHPERNKFARARPMSA